MLDGCGDLVYSSWIQLLVSLGKPGLQACAVDVHALAVFYPLFGELRPEDDYRLHPETVPGALLDVRLDLPGRIECARANPPERFASLRIVASVEVWRAVFDLHHALKVLGLQQIHAVRADRDVVVV